MAKDTMKAVVFEGPHKIAVEDRPIPKIKEPEDVIVKVIYSALCGSELHVFRVPCFKESAYNITDEFPGSPTKPDRLHHGTALRIS